jgi:hypothetical protein
MDPSTSKRNSYKTMPTPASLSGQNTRRSQRLLDSISPARRSQRLLDNISSTRHSQRLLDSISPTTCRKRLIDSLSPSMDHAGSHQSAFHMSSTQNRKVSCCISTTMYDDSILDLTKHRRLLSILQPLSDLNSYGIFLSSSSKMNRSTTPLHRRPFKKRRTSTSCMSAATTNSWVENKPSAVQTDERPRSSQPPRCAESNSKPNRHFSTTESKKSDARFPPSSVSSRGELTFDTLSNNESVPSPSPFLRVEGQSTTFNTYSGGAHMKHFVYSLGLRSNEGASFQTVASSLRVSPLALSKHARVATPKVELVSSPPKCYSDTKPSSATTNRKARAAYATYPTAIENDIAATESVKGKKPPPVALKTTTTRTAKKEASPNPNNRRAVSFEAVEQAPTAEVNIPASLMTGRLIATQHGLAMLLVPNDNISAAEYAAFASSVTNPSTASAQTKCKHWTKAEDELLKFAVSKEDGPPYTWTELARNYFPATRNANQVCRLSQQIVRKVISSHHILSSPLGHSARRAGRSSTHLQKRNSLQTKRTRSSSTVTRLVSFGPKLPPSYQAARRIKSVIAL